MDQYLRFVKPSFDNHIQPTSAFADVIVRGESNEVAVELIASHIRRTLDNCKQELRKEMYDEIEEDMHAPATEQVVGALPDTVVLMEQTTQLRVS